MIARSSDHRLAAAALMGGVLLAATLFLSIFDPHRAPDGVLVLDGAESVRIVDEDGEILFEQDGVVLSQDWRTDIPRAGAMPVDMVDGHYELRFEGAAVRGKALRLLIPRVARTVDIELNGGLILDQGDLDPGRSWEWYTPTTVDIPQGVVVPGENRLDAIVRASFQSTAGLSRLFLGETRAITAMEERLVLLQEILPFYANLVTLIMALPLFLIWLHGRRVGGPFGDYGLLAVAVSLFALRSMHVYAGEAPLPMNIWLPMVSVSLGLAIALFGVFLLRFAGASSRWFEWGLAAFVLVATIVQFADPEGAFMRLRTLVWYVPIAFVGVACIAVFCVRTVMAPDRDRMILAMSVLLLVPTAIHDLLWVRGFLAFESVMWLPLTMPLVLLAISATVANRFARAWVTAEAHNRDLSRQVEEARRELAASYDARLRAERREVAASERSMLVEDLHDGVGNRLSLLLATARSPGFSSARLMGAIRECLDDLRMVMAARDHGSLGEALAEIGTLQADMLDAAGVLLEVECEPAASELDLGARRTLNLLRVVQEAVSNALSHAGAGRVSVTCALAGPGVLEVRISDDGLGRKRKGVFPKSTGRGMSTMAARAERLGGELSIDKSASGWTVRLLVPIAAGAGLEFWPAGQDALSHAEDRLPRGDDGKPVPKGLAESQA